MAKYDAYVICTSPRSGSTLLCQLLAATRIAGNPASYFHLPSVSDWLADLAIHQGPEVPEHEALRAAFRAAIARGSLGTGVFGLRLQRHSFDFFAQKLAVLHPEQPSDAQRFRAAFGRTLFLHLTRNDKLEQAVSYLKAQQTGLWHVAPDGTELERLAPHQEPTYDFDRIQRCLETMKTYDRDWATWFEREKIDPFRISYEALSADPLKIVGQILHMLGLGEEAAKGVKLGVKKLADAVNQDWVTRFRAEEHSR